MKIQLDAKKGIYLVDYFHKNAKIIDSKEFIEKLENKIDENITYGTIVNDYLFDQIDNEHGINS